MRQDVYPSICKVLCWEEPRACGHCAPQGSSSSSTGRIMETYRRAFTAGYFANHIFLLWNLSAVGSWMQQKCHKNLQTRHLSSKQYHIFFLIICLWRLAVRKNENTCTGIPTPALSRIPVKVFLWNMAYRILTHASLQDMCASGPQRT